MCGRFVVFSNLETLVAHFAVDRVETPVTASYNVAPSRPVAAVVRREDQNLLVPLRWGLVPFWAKDASIATRLINARAETAADKAVLPRGLPKTALPFGGRRVLRVAGGARAQAAGLHHPDGRGADGLRRPLGGLGRPGAGCDPLEDLHDFNHCGEPRPAGDPRPDAARSEARRLPQLARPAAVGP